MVTRSVAIGHSIVEGILSYARATHPREVIVLLNGTVEGDEIVIDGVEIPPLSARGHGFSNFPLHMLPIDFSVVGTAHSHPSGVLRPSIGDLNSFYGRIAMIVGYPYRSEEDVAIFDSVGKQVKYRVVADR